MKTTTRWQRILPAWHKQAFFSGNEAATTPHWCAIRLQGKKKLSLPAQLKLEWIIFHHTQGKNKTTTAKHFGITRKTLHKWLKLYEKHDLSGLEEASRAPAHVRKRQITLQQQQRIKTLRTIYPKYGKMKLEKIYQAHYQETLSSWKIQKSI